MKRLLETQLLHWKNADRRKPLILRGARQVGKTWLIENVLAREFDHLDLVAVGILRIRENRCVK